MVYVCFVRPKMQKGGKKKDIKSSETAGSGGPAELPTLHFGCPSTQTYPAWPRNVLYDEMRDEEYGAAMCTAVKWPFLEAHETDPGQLTAEMQTIEEMRYNIRCRGRAINGFSGRPLEQICKLSGNRAELPACVPACLRACRLGVHISYHHRLPAGSQASGQGSQSVFAMNQFVNMFVTHATLR